MLRRSGYSWCNGDNCITTDAAPLTLEDMTPIVVKGGVEIKTTPPEGINEFTIKNLTAPEIDGYTVPNEPGWYYSTKFTALGFSIRDRPIFTLLLLFNKIEAPHLGV